MFTWALIVEHGMRDWEKEELMKTETIAMSVPRDTFYLGFLRSLTSELARRGGFELGVVGQIEMAVDEACANACEHQSCESPIEFEISLCEQQLTVTLRDDGMPFSAPTNFRVDMDEWAESEQEGGLGLHIINAFMDEVHYQHHEGVGNVLCMKKYR